MENENLNYEQLLISNQKLSRNLSELLWASIFHDSIKDSTWLKETDFCPGRWAIGYAYLYVLYRILNEAHPYSILDLGLGQTSKMISQYVSYFPQTQHIIVENDTSWTNFAKKSFKIKDKSKIIHLNYKMEDYKNHEIRVYDNFQNTFIGKKFNLISIDAPFGADMNYYSRIDILSILPNCLEKSFIILLDDYDRSPEKNTVHDIIECLKLNNIEFYTHCYSSAKDCYIITSPDNKWFCSL